MTTSPKLGSLDRLEHVRLGDVLHLPEGRNVTVRSKVRLPRPTGSMAAFLILGELDLLLSLPLTPGEDVGLYTALTYLPPRVRDAALQHEGACNYWAPHLPSQRQAMGELLWRVATFPGSVDPLVVVFRGKDVRVFIRSDAAPPDAFGTAFMPRDAEDVSEVDRHTAVVVAPNTAPEKVVPLYERISVKMTANGS